MQIKLNSEPAPGWVGGFAQSNPKFAYPQPDLTSLPMLCNMDNINLLQRQQGVEWPEFSWETQKGHPDPKRCFQMFAPYLSRLGYTNAGRVYSVICPQQGIYIPGIGYLNVEISVTGQRGWVDETPTPKALAVDLTVEGKMWFGPSAHRSSLGADLLALIGLTRLPVPWRKANAIIVTTHKFQHPDQPIASVRTGEIDRFVSPEFAKHPEAWAVGNVEVEVGPIQTTGYRDVDFFNGLVMELFNLASSNMLQCGNLLSWNLWFTAPQLVDKEEWRDHAEKWRKSIDEDHGSPCGPGTVARYFNGDPVVPFGPDESAIEEAQPLRDIRDYLKRQASRI